MLGRDKTVEDWQSDLFLGRHPETITGIIRGYGFTAAGTVYDFEDRLTAHARTSGTISQSWSLTSV